jgi:drug/metabolite transporter (DMT)-like permease
MRANGAGYAPLLVAAASIGTGTVATKKAYGLGAAPGEILTVRLALAAVLVIAVVGLTDRASLRGWDRASIVTAAAAGVALWFNWQTELIGLSHIGPGVLILLATTSPAFAAIVAAVAWRRAPTRAEVGAIALITLGVAVMANPLGTPLTAIGVAAGLATALGSACFLLVFEGGGRRRPAMTLAGALVVACLLSVVVDPTALGAVGAHRESLPLVLGVGVCAAVWGLFAVLGLGRVTATRAAIVLSIEPVFVAALAYVVLGERLSAAQLAGGAIVVGAVVLVTRTAPERRPAAPPVSAGSARPRR